MLKAHGAARPADEIDSRPLSPRRSALPGPRPIVVAGDPQSEDGRLPGEFAEIFRPYFDSADGSEDRSVLAPDCDEDTLCAAKTVGAKKGSMLRDKGCEWFGVIISDRAPRRAGDAHGEWLYTALTRPTGVLVLVLWPDGQEDTKAVLGLLQHELLRFTSEEAERLFWRACRLRPEAAPG